MKKVIRWWNSRHSGTDGVLDTILNTCIDSGIKDCHYECSALMEGYCEFNNGYVYRYWDRSKPFAWLDRGKFLYNNNVMYYYEEGMPSKKTMNKFYNAICEYFIKNCSKL